MAITVEAVYENGVLKLSEPLPFKEHEQVQVTVQPITSWAEATAGMMGFKGTAEEAEYFALDPELDYPPPPEDA
jgi:predicted DNA-binding antitoxin AbrB/MazE fold protein